MEQDIFPPLLEAVWQETRAPEYAARYAELDLAHLLGQRSAISLIGDLFTREERERAEQASRLRSVLDALPESAEGVAALVLPAMLLAGLSPMNENERAFFGERLGRAQTEITRVNAAIRRHQYIA